MHFFCFFCVFCLLFLKILSEKIGIFGADLSEEFYCKIKSKESDLGIRLGVSNEKKIHFSVFVDVYLGRDKHPEFF